MATISDRRSRIWNQSSLLKWTALATFLVAALPFISLGLIALIDGWFDCPPSGEFWGACERHGIRIDYYLEYLSVVVLFGWFFLTLPGLVVFVIALIAWIVTNIESRRNE